MPVWVLVNFLDFGTLRTFYSLMLDEDKIEIANYSNKHFHFKYGIDPRIIPSEIDSFLTNIVAHDNRLLQYRLRKKAISNKTLLESYPQTNTNSVFYVYLTLRLF